MSRTKGYRVKLWRQGVSEARGRSEDVAEYIRDGDEPQLFLTKADAEDAAQAYLKDRPELTFALEPVAE